MAEFNDVVKALIEDTESGKLDWNIGTDSGGYWHTSCDGVHFSVRSSGLVQVYGSVPSTDLGRSSDLLELLHQSKPLKLEVARDEAMKRALECLRGEKPHNQAGGTA